MAISLMGGDDPPAQTIKSGRKRRSNVKTLVIDLLTEAGTIGLNASTAVERANRKGITLERPSASSILSRLKAAEIADYDGDVYRLKKFVNSN